MSNVSEVKKNRRIRTRNMSFQPYFLPTLNFEINLLFVPTTVSPLPLYLSTRVVAVAALHARIMPSVGIGAEAHPCGQSGLL